MYVYIDIYIYKDTYIHREFLMYVCIFKKNTHFITLRSIAVHHITLHYITLTCITLHYIHVLVGKTEKQYLMNHGFIPRQKSVSTRAEHPWTVTLVSTAKANGTKVSKKPK